MAKKRVVVGMSGGVDSSVAAYLLIQEGYEVIGLFMRNWNDASVTLEDECPWIDDSRDAMLVAEQLGIPFQVIDLSDMYKSRIVDYMFREYEIGRTPNPDVLCNREIKFDIFLDAALKLGADFVATGHYVQKGEIFDGTNTEFMLLEGKDPSKDQSYFLCQLNQFQLSKALFPIGGLLKSEVRSIAIEKQLVTAQKKDSQGLCFIGKVSLPQFLQQQLKPKPGVVVEIPSDFSELNTFFDCISENNNEFGAIQRIQFSAENGEKIGEHSGAHFYTRGQRKGLNIGGKPLALFVLQTDVVNNIIYVGQGENHPALFYRGLKVLKSDAHWIRPSTMEDVRNDILVLHCRIRYRQEKFLCKMKFDSEGNILVIFEELKKNVTPGQFVSVYCQNEVIFSGVIFE
jgi:tRNA-specific 2-thiouridylase